MVGLLISPSFVSFMQFSWSSHAIYCCTYLLQECSCALEHDKLDQVYFCDRSFPPYFLVLCNFDGHLVKCIDVRIFFSCSLLCLFYDDSNDDLS